MSEEKTRKPRRDRGKKRVIENFMVVACDNENNENLICDGSGVAKVFSDVATFKSWLNDNAKLGESYQPVVAAGEPWAFQIAPQGKLL